MVKCNNYDKLFEGADFDQLERMGVPIWDTGDMDELERDRYYDETLVQAEKDWKKKSCAEKKRLLTKAGLMER